MGCVWNFLIESFGYIAKSRVSRCNSKFDLHPGPKLKDPTHITHAHTCLSTHTHTHAHSQTHTHMLTRTHTHTHTHKHTNTHTHYSYSRLSMQHTQTCSVIPSILLAQRLCPSESPILEYDLIKNWQRHSQQCDWQDQLTFHDASGLTLTSSGCLLLLAPIRAHYCQMDCSLRYRWSCTHNWIG